ncbi:MAG: B12-binding domain-containing radical SAM protein [Desulfomonile tiedjei]|uniref:B12-binding domain-containing radical SAM protein n=1 Tax=Desulfomonile tiedjei TaxID=2358 RepID=A0A9D6V3P2_9BACT|nr:B12-binding domain-containing radical SAM protein [Desulfomonile tiedjei]
MRVLLINPETPESFWTFSNTRKFLGRKALIPPLGLITVAGLLPREWEFRLVDLAARKLTDDDWNWADMVMMSAMIVQRESLLALIKEGKQKGKLIVVGGPYPTSLPDEALEAGCDFLVRGEGESAIPILLEALEQGQTGGIIDSKTKPELSDSPIPRFDLLNFDDYIVLGVQTSRGCPFDCEFCDIVNLYGRKPRYKTGDQLIEELETIYQLGWRREVFITDDNFIGSKSHARNLLAKLTPWMKDHGEPFVFWTQTSVNLGQDLGLIDLLTAANFSTVFLGIESQDEDILALNGKFQNIQNPLLESVNNINANGLSIVASFVIGFDNEKPGAGEGICSFVDTAGIPIVVLNMLHALPNTRLWDRLKKEGRLVETNTTGQTTGEKMNFIPTRPESEIVAEYLGAWDHLYAPSRYLERAYRWFLKMRPTRAALGNGEDKSVRVTRISAGTTQWNIVQDLDRFARFSWKAGIRSDHKMQYWKQFFGMWRHNPSRLVKYVNVCALGDNMIAFKKVVHDRIGKRVADEEPMSKRASTACR